MTQSVSPGIKLFTTSPTLRLRLNGILLFLTCMALGSCGLPLSNQPRGQITWQTLDPSPQASDTRTVTQVTPTPTVTMTPTSTTIPATSTHTPTPTITPTPSSTPIL